MVETSNYTPPISFAGLAAQQQRVRTEIDQAISSVLEHGNYILGDEIKEFEQKIAQYCGVEHAVTCSSGTDALLMALMAKGIGPGDAVLLPSFTFISTAEVVVTAGATPVLIDVNPDNYLVDHAQIHEVISQCQEYEPKAIIAVDLFGQPADYDALNDIAEKYGLFLIADAAQSFGATLHGKKTGNLAPVTATSFFPAKPLGCYGDGGALFTNDQELADIFRSIRVHGKGKDKYDNVRVGINGRMDTIQAAILLKKLEIFGDELTRREKVAQNYISSLHEYVKLPAINPKATSAWAQFTIQIENRERVASKLKQKGVPAAIYYPKPIHLQSAYNHFPVSPAGLSVSEQLSERVLSLPMHPYIEEAAQEYIINNIIECVK